MRWIPGVPEVVPASVARPWLVHESLRRRRSTHAEGRTTTPARPEPALSGKGWSTSAPSPDTHHRVRPMLSDDLTPACINASRIER